jgi:hypothetical protein
VLRASRGLEFERTVRVDHWCRERKITLAYIQPGKLTQNRDLSNAENSKPS